MCSLRRRAGDSENKTKQARCSVLGYLLGCFTAPDLAGAQAELWPPASLLQGRLLDAAALRGELSRGTQASLLQTVPERPAGFRNRRYCQLQLSLSCPPRGRGRRRTHTQRLLEVQSGHCKGQHRGWGFTGEKLKRAKSKEREFSGSTDLPSPHARRSRPDLLRWLECSAPKEGRSP